MNEVASFRKEKDELFDTTEESPLTPEQKKGFSGLKYFPEESRFRVEAALEKDTSEETVAVKTSAGDTEAYKRYGKIKFSLDGQELSLNVYQSTDSSHLFLPFMDKTNEAETYHDGRYVEIEDEDGKVDLDFNYAYNPYCAYNENFRCPITPEENTLSVVVNAGEKRFH